MLLVLVLGTFAFSEIMYDWPGADTNHEWVEVVNCSGATVEITNSFRFFDGTNHLIADPIQGSRFIPAGGIFILAADAKTATSTFFSDHPGFTGTVFDTVMSLGNSGDTLELRGEGGIVLAVVTYQSSWGGQGSGKSIEKEDPCNGSPSGGWKESSAMGGTPGSALPAVTGTPVPMPAAISSYPTSSPTPSLVPSQALVPTPASTVYPAPSSAVATSMPQPSPSPTPLNVLTPSPSQTPKQSPILSPTASSIPLPSVTASVFSAAPLVNEFLPSPSGPDAQNEYIELLNPSDAALDISGWFLDDEDGGSSPYQIPSGTIMAPRGILVFAGAITHIALNNDGDSVRLLQPGKIVNESITYGKAEEGHAYARRYDRSDQDLSGEPRSERAGDATKREAFWRGRGSEATEEGGAWHWTNLPTPGSANVFTQKPSEVKAEKNTSLGKTTPLSSSALLAEGSPASLPNIELDLTGMPERKSLFAWFGSAEIRGLVLAASVAISLSLLLVFARRFF